MALSTNIKRKVCVCVCLFVLYSRPHRGTDDGGTRREGGHRAGIGFSESSNPMRQPVCQILAKNTRFFGQNSLSGGCRVAEWTREKSGHFWVKQHWGMIVLGWEAAWELQVLLHFFSFSRFLSASREIFAKQKLTSSLALTYKKFGGPTWTLGSHLTLTTGPGSTGGEKIIKQKLFCRVGLV